jgi:replicative DNA helicase
MNKKKRPQTAVATIPQIALDQGKVPPQALDLEEVVLGSLMLEKDALVQVADILKPDCFYKEAHVYIYTAIQSMYSRSEPVDILTVTNELKGMGKLEEVGGAYYVSQLTNHVASTSNVEFHARIVLQKFILRKLISLSSEITRDAFDETTDAFDLIDNFDVAVSEINGIFKSSDTKHISSVSSSVKEFLDDDGLGRSNIPCGLDILQKSFGGWFGGELTIVAGRPGTGKSSLAVSLMMNIADSGVPVAIFSFEMKNNKTYMRMMSQEARVEHSQIKLRTLSNSDRKRCDMAMEIIDKKPIYMNDSSDMNIKEFRSKCIGLKKSYGIKMVIVDYLQLMTADGLRKEEIVSKISRGLKIVATELDIPVMALSQMSRGIESRTGDDKKPKLSDLRDSGAIEQDADNVIFLHKPDVDSEEIELVVAKHRDGEAKDLMVRFIEKYTLFEEYARPHSTQESGEPF